MSFRSAPVPRVMRDRRDDRYQAGRHTPFKHQSAGWVKSIEDDGTCTVVVLNEDLTGLIPLDGTPTPGAVVEIESRGDLMCIRRWYEHPLPPPEELPYLFTDGYDQGQVDPAWEAALIPSLSDDSDATFVHFVGVTGHDFVRLNGDVDALPTGHVTAMEFAVRARSAPQDGTFIGLLPRIRSLTTSKGYIEYRGPAPDFSDGVRLPKGTAFGNVSVTLTEEQMPLALSNDYEDWDANNASADAWTTLDGFVETLRTTGFEMWIQYGGSIYGTWDIASLNLIFHTETP